MATISELDSAEKEFLTQFKKLCRDAKGDLSTITHGLKNRPLNLSIADKSKLEDKIRGQFMHMKQNNLH